MLKQLASILQWDGLDLTADFERAKLKGRYSPQEIADFREGAFKPFISRYYPFPYRIAKGMIHDSYGLASCSVDCIVINPNHPYTIDVSAKLSIILTDGVDIAIEIKPDITRTREFERGLDQIRTIKKLKRAEPVVIGRPAEDFNTRIPAFIFAIEAARDLHSVVATIHKYNVEKGVPIEEQVDMVVVHNRGIVANYKTKKFKQMPGQGFGDSH